MFIKWKIFYDLISSSTSIDLNICNKLQSKIVLINNIMTNIQQELVCIFGLYD